MPSNSDVLHSVLYFATALVSSCCNCPVFPVTPSCSSLLIKGSLGARCGGDRCNASVKRRHSCAGCEGLHSVRGTAAVLSCVAVFAVQVSAQAGFVFVFVFWDVTSCNVLNIYVYIYIFFLTFCRHTLFPAARARQKVQASCPRISRCFCIFRLCWFLIVYIL